jgi:hypothetical protein
MGAQPVRSGRCPSGIQLSKSSCWIRVSFVLQSGNGSAVFRHVRSWKTASSAAFKVQTHVSLLYLLYTRSSKRQLKSSISPVKPSSPSVRDSTLNNTTVYSTS